MEEDKEEVKQPPNGSPDIAGRLMISNSRWFCLFIEMAEYQTPERNMQARDFSEEPPAPRGLNSNSRSRRRRRDNEQDRNNRPNRRQRENESRNAAAANTSS